MRKEAGRFGADAIIFVEWRETTRYTFNGFAATANILSAFDNSDDCDCCDDEPLEMDEEYNAQEIEGIAIYYYPGDYQFKNQERKAFRNLPCKIKAGYFGMLFLKNLSSDRAVFQELTLI